VGIDGPSIDHDTVRSTCQQQPANRRFTVAASAKAENPSSIATGIANSSACAVVVRRGIAARGCAQPGPRIAGRAELWGRLWDNPGMAALIILGCGYIGTRLARTALAAGRIVRVCGRSTGRLAALAEVGAQVKYVDAAVPKQLGPVVSGLAGATVVYSIPPVASLPPGHGIRAGLQAAYGAGAGCFVHFSSAGLYGSQPDDEVWIDEDSPIARDDPPMAGVLSDEREVEICQFDRLRTVTLRLAPVYGPGRGMRERLRKGEYRILDDGSHATSRIHVDDVVNVVFAAEDRAPSRSRYLVADDEPATQGQYAQWLSERMGLAMPPSRQMFEPGAPRAAHRNRRVRNARLKAELGVTLRYPTYREGEAAIEAEAAARAEAKA
jgi:nucleoside-diphosphate-sugar epimerase